MSLSNSTFSYLKETCDGAISGAEIEGAEILPSLYAKMADGKKFVRVGDVQFSVPDTVGNKIVEFNAHLTVQIVIRPDSQKLEDLLEARRVATAIAGEITTAIYDGEAKMPDATGAARVCDVRVARKEDDWGDYDTKLHAVSYLLLHFNQR